MSAWESLPLVVRIAGGVVAILVLCNVVFPVLGWLLELWSDWRDRVRHRRFMDRLNGRR